MVEMSVKLGGLKLQNPIMPASGTFSERLGAVFDLNRLGALVTKSVFYRPRKGNPTPRVAETADGMLNSIGIPSQGIPHFLAHALPHYRELAPPLVVSISANTMDEFAEACAAISVPGVSAIEVNISCPNLEADGRAFAMTPEPTFRVMRRVREATGLPLWAKLTPNTGDVAAVAKAAEAGGADALVVANTILALSIDVETFRPRLGSVMGGLSGPAIRPVIVRMVFQCARAVKIPIVGVGGIMTAADVVEYLLAGASAVQVGTATFVHPRAMIDIIDGLADWCARRGIARVDSLIGAVDLAPDQEIQEFFAS